jgi:hypothetical protein
VAGLAALGLNYDVLKARVDKAFSWEKQPYAGYELTNLGARIRADKERIKLVEARTSRQEQAEAKGVLIEGAEYVRVTFPEKPERSILDALKAAGFYWSQGSWCGYRAKLPCEVMALGNIP